METNDKLTLNKEGEPRQLAVFKDSSYHYLYQRAQRVVTALYMITNFMSVNEPLKWQIRENSLSFLNSIMSLSKASLSGRSQVMVEIGGYLSQIETLFNIAYKSGFISGMNFGVVRKEIAKLTDLIIECDSDKLSMELPLFNKTFFSDASSKGQSESARDRQDKKRADRLGARGIQVGGGSPARRDKIMSIIKDKKEVSVKDISAMIPNCSEKTLQRELSGLVAEGLLTKEGERRWSRYYLKNR
ncbi:MAG TPA: hypothetical protein P5328_00675 [Candidatus Paceibacterota bacterium]|nr:hypothetical protein [Candidatus Paceibacterota bacterium]HRZ34165.1 hypothetical protein [Candidatus Paceibacterota bacterium]